MTLAELDTAVADGVDLRETVLERRRVHEHEMRRRHVPTVVLSDGTDVESVLPRPALREGDLGGTAAAPGVVTGRARVVLDPAQARVEPGEVLVAPTTDPGRTPLFLTAAGLVTETGSSVAHGPTVAREYGIPAVVGVQEATHKITTGQRVTVDGSAGTVVPHEEHEASAPSTSATG